MKFRMKVKDECEGREPWWEDYDKPIDDAQQEAERLINYFNQTLRPHETPRTLLAVEVLESDDERNAENVT